MTDELTKANINLFAVLRNLEDLCEIDEEVKNIIKGKSMTIQFIVKGGCEAYISFINGKCSVKKGKTKSDIILYFKSPKHLNDMFDGKANPIPLKGFTKLDFLKNEFTKLTECLAFYLKPDEEKFKNLSYLKINTFLTLYTAVYALAQIGNYDKVGKLNASRIPDGVVAVSVMNGGPTVYITSKSGSLEASKTVKSSPRAFMTFSNLDTANAVLNGKLDSYTAMGTGDFQIKGFIPMLDNMNKLLAQVPAYVK